jgi:16S rRNA C967 or C1407 C5-methylase (RsmB/RsmF family)
MATKKTRAQPAAGLPRTGPLAFAGWYGAMHPERWAGLSRACALPNRHFELTGGLACPYYLDPASVLAALCLDISPGQSVLDLCAAPGGKTLVIAQRLFGLVPADPGLDGLGRMGSAAAAGDGAADDPAGDAPEVPGGDDPAAGAGSAGPDGPDASGFPGAPGAAELPGSRLVANERSAARRGRLRQVLARHLPAACLPAIRTTGFDAAAWGQHEQSAYDRILLDVPCSSERHLIQDPAWLDGWSPRRSQQLAQQAYAMGLSAGRALKTGGRLLYCTCALSNLENDDTVGRILDRSRAQASRFGYRLEALAGTSPGLEALPAGVRRDLAELVETTALGLRIWPDRPHGFGPLYFSLLQKVDS